MNLVACCVNGFVVVCYSCLHLYFEDKHVVNIFHKWEQDLITNRKTNCRANKMIMRSISYA